MMTDPLERDILLGLAGELDPQTFEDCCGDLLSDTFPGLVPIRGGKDAGMDGAIADAAGEAFPLVCTTSRDFLRNFVDSLESFVAHGRIPRKVVFATSREVTPPQRRKLEDRAREKGFTLVQVIDSHGLAQRLYWSPRWLRGLLGLSASPLALSAIPKSRRPLPNLQPVGRDGDLDWLRTTVGHRVLVGEPGSGKTFLLRHLIQGGWDAYFLVDSNRGEIKRALLDLKPATVVVDDAHAQIEALRVLEQLREEMGADFSIVATTWSFAEHSERVLAELPGAQVRSLRLLPRHQILEIFEQAGVHGPDDLLRDLVDQAANKPGLAATIADLWKRGAWRDVLDGKALRREILTGFGDIGVGFEDLLATLSLGGDGGMTLEAARQFLGLNLPEVRRQATALAAGGVLNEEREGALSVRPRQLRTSLLRTVFFPESVPGLDYRDLLQQVPSLSRAVLELAWVHASGKPVPGVRDLLLQVGATDHDTRTAWELVGGSSVEDAHWVQENFPGDFLAVAGILLERLPEEIIPDLFQGASVEARSGARESRSMHILAGWVQGFDLTSPANLETALSRRHRIGLAAKRFLQTGGDQATGVRGLFVALLPSQRWTSRDPGFSNTVKFWRALLPLSALRQITEDWDQVKRELVAPDKATWSQLNTALWDWIYPQNAAGSVLVPNEAQVEMQGFARRVLEDLVPLSDSSPGLRSGIARLADRLPSGLGVEVKLDSTFELLYPESYGGSKPEDRDAWKVQLSRMADEWLEWTPKVVAEVLVNYESEAERIGYSWPRGSQEICRRLAESTPSPEVLLEALEEAGLPETFIAPFLRRLLREQREGWEESALHFLELDRYLFTAIDEILSLPHSPPYLVKRALDRASIWPGSVETLALRRELPPHALRAALLHPDPNLALAAAVGEWDPTAANGPREEYRSEWRAALRRAPSDGASTGPNHWLGDILAQDPDLALDWLTARLRDAEPATYAGSQTWARALAALRPEQRSRLLREVEPLPILSSLLPSLVKGDPELFRQLLQRPELRDFHLSPLSARPGESWCELAKLALEAGHSPEKIAEATTWNAYLSGQPHDYPPVSFWTEIRGAFEAIEESIDSRVRAVLKEGSRIAQEELQRAEEQLELMGLRGI